MLCFRCRKLLIPYSEGELASGAREKVERHLSGCERCRCDLEAIRSVANTLLAADAPAAEPAPDLWAGIRARIVGETPKPAPRVWLRAPQAISAAAMVILIAAVGLTLMRSGILTQRPDYAPSGRQQARVDDQTKPDDLALGVGENGTRAGVGDTTTEKPPAVDSSKHTVDEAREGREIDSIAVRPSPAPKGVTPRERLTEARPSTHRPAPVVDRPAEPERTHVGVTVATVDGPATDYYAGAEPVRGDATELSYGADVAPVAVGDAGGVTTARAPSTPGAGAEYFFLGEGADSAHGESVVDALTETEGIRTAALFTYP